MSMAYIRRLTLASWAEPDLNVRERSGVKPIPSCVPCCKIFAVQSDCSISKGLFSAFKVKLTAWVSPESKSRVVF